MHYKIAFHDTSFFKNGFRFRFLSYGSLSGAIDIWNLDYVLLKTYPPSGFDSNLKEIAFVNRSFSLIHPYTSMPWKHLVNNQSTYLNSSIDLRYKYLSNTLAINTSFKDFIFDVNGVQKLTSSFSANVNPLTDTIHSFSLNTLVLTSPNNDSASFSSLHTLSNFGTGGIIDSIRTNDSIVFNYKFYNYYSYDDGTSEVGFDLINAPGGKVAMRFDLAQADTLRAVRMLFVQQNASAANKLFTLKIWSSLTPETVI